VQLVKADAVREGGCNFCKKRSVAQPGQYVYVIKSEMNLEVRICKSCLNELKSKPIPKVVGEVK